MRKTLVPVGRLCDSAIWKTGWHNSFPDSPKLQTVKPKFNYKTPNLCSVPPVPSSIFILMDPFGTTGNAAVLSTWQRNHSGDGLERDENSSTQLPEVSIFPTYVSPKTPGIRHLWPSCCRNSLKKSDLTFISCTSNCHDFTLVSLPKLPSRVVQYPRSITGCEGGHVWIYRTWFKEETFGRCFRWFHHLWLFPKGPCQGFMLCLMAKRLQLDQGAYPQRPAVFLEGTSM